MRLQMRYLVTCFQHTGGQTRDISRESYWRYVGLMPKSPFAILRNHLSNMTESEVGGKIDIKIIAVDLDACFLFKIDLPRQ